MHDVLDPCTPADYAFLVGLLESSVSFTDDRTLHIRLADLERDPTPENRTALDLQIERELRYLGSADVAYFIRWATGRPPGVPFREILGDVARHLKIKAQPLGTDREVLEDLVQRYATEQFGRLSPEEQQRMLEELGVERGQAAAFIKKSAGVFAVPVLVQAFGLLVVEGLIKTVIFGTIAKIVGRQLSNRLFGLLAARLPWWVTWVGPAAWTASISWAVADLQGPAYRKTVPAVLYLGLCCLRDTHGVEGE